MSGKERSRRALCAACWLALAVFCWAGAASALQTLNIQTSVNRVSFRETGTVATAFSSIKKLRDTMQGVYGGEPSAAAVTAWTQALSQSVAHRETNGSASVDILWFDGSAADIWSLQVVRGIMPGQGDTTGCALDDATTLKLFGSTNVIGQTVTVGGKDLTLRAVFRLPTGATSFAADPGRGLAFCPAAAGSDTLRVTAYEFLIPTGSEQEPGAQAKGYLTSAGLRAPSTMYKRADQRQVYALMSKIPGALICLFLLIELVRGAWGLTRATIRHSRDALRSMTLPSSVGHRIAFTGIGVLILFLGAMAFAVWQMPRDWHVPPAYLPTQWSDLSFWPALVTTWAKNETQMAFSVAFRPDLVWRTLAVWIGALGALSTFSLLLARRALKQSVQRGRLPAHAALLTAALCLAPVLALLLARAVGWTGVSAPGLALMPSVYFLAFSCLRAFPVALTLPIRAYRAACKRLKPAEAAQAAITERSQSL